MSKELRLKIAGIVISIKWDKTRLIGRSHPFYKDFICHDKPKVTLNVHCRDFPEYSCSEPIFDGETEGRWKLYAHGAGYIIETFDTLTGRKNKICFLVPDFCYGDVYIHPELERWSPTRIKGHFFRLPSLMQPLCEIILLNLLTMGKGIMAHGLGINDRGRGIVFLGGSGAGKSTLAHLYGGEKGVDILSDEHIIIRKEKGRFYLYGTPWPGDAMRVSSRRVPLEKVFFIEHASRNRIYSFSGAGSFLPLLFLPFWNKMGITRVLELCEDLTGEIECRRLGFVKDKSVIDFIRQKNCNSV